MPFVSFDVTEVEWDAPPDDPPPADGCLRGGPRTGRGRGLAPGARAVPSRADPDAGTPAPAPLASDPATRAGAGTGARGRSPRRVAEGRARVDPASPRGRARRHGGVDPLAAGGVPHEGGGAL